MGRAARSAGDDDSGRPREGERRDRRIPDHENLRRHGVCRHHRVQRRAALVQPQRRIDVHVFAPREAAARRHQGSLRDQIQRRSARAFQARPGVRADAAAGVLVGAAGREADDPHRQRNDLSPVTRRTIAAGKPLRRPFVPSEMHTTANDDRPRHRFGSHLSVAGGVFNALIEARRLRCDAVQVFVKNQRQWKAPPLQADVIQRWRDQRAVAKNPLLVAHATYLINLASGDAALHARSRAAFADELLRCDALDIPYLVVHPGAAGEQERDRAIANVANALNRIFREHADIRCMPLLETTAGQGTSLGRTFAELGAILRRLDEPHRVGVCVDTCHVFAAGYDIRDGKAYAAMISEARREVGLERIRCWHLNDSKGELGGRRDRHEHIGRGRIGTAGFRNVLADKRFVGLPMILETPKGENGRGREWDRVNLQRLRTIATRAGIS
ncbi:MAG: deoxyribonuclease IV [Planctomycetota bacterium]|nr:MAG: deoxyribonuclease IV [Planctomycetota bacterium]